MSPEQVRKHVRQEPFIPVRIYVSDGSAYDVRDPEYVYVDRREISIGIEIGDDGVPNRTAYVDPLHITRIEPIVTGPSTNGHR